LYYVDVAVSTPPQFDPPVTNETAFRLIDDNNETCVQLSTANMYTFSTRLGSFFPPPQDICFLPGLAVKTWVPKCIKHSFSVTITGRRVVCSDSLIELLMKEDKSQLKCGGGGYHKCKLSDATKSGDGGMSTCVGECRCDGENCRSLQINIEEYKEEWNWSICEIRLT